jgi:hypothetical protein
MSTTHSHRPTGSADGQGSGDHDIPYRFGWKPRVSQTYPFSQRQYARLLLLRSRVQERLVSDGVFGDEPWGS